MDYTLIRQLYGRKQYLGLSPKSNGRVKRRRVYNRFMKKIILTAALTFSLTACDIWGVAPQPFPVLSPVPSNTPSVITATPFIIQQPTLVVTSTPTSAAILSPTTDAAPQTPTLMVGTPTETATQPKVQSVAVDILGCDTGFDIQNGMFEVTNAYVTVKNTGNIELPNTCALLRAADEGREHPDKRVCAGTLPVQNQVTLKLTVDSTYQENTFIQIDITSNEIVLLRVDKASCRDINVFGGIPVDIGIIKPIQP